MKKIVFTLVISLYCLLLFSQGGLGSRDIYQQTSDIMREVKMNQITQNGMRNSKLNFFLNEDWKAGVMFSKDSSVINNHLYRYNIYTDQIELRSIVNPKTIDIISIGSQKFVYSEFYTEDSMRNEGYFELLENGECKLLLRRNIKFTEGRDDIEAYGASTGTSIKERLYIKKGGDPAVMIEKSKEALKEMLFDKEQAIKYIDGQLILFMTEKRIKDIVNYYNNI